MSPKIREFFAYGEAVEGYEVRVLNEREARAAAGILFAFGLLGLMNSITLGHVIFTKYFIAFFTLDFLIRVIQPRYAPSLLVGRFFVQNQKPEYVGAAQKRFAWSIGLLLALPMFYTLVLHFVPTPVKVFICIICLVLLIMESAFSICVGCKLYELIHRKRAQHCPGGVCEIREKEPIQRFNAVQKFIVIVVFVLTTYGLYSFITKVESKTFLAQKIKTMFMSEAELQAQEEAEYQQQLRAFDEDEDF